MILQDLWKLKISWDEVVPMDIFTKWVAYQTQLVKLNQLQIPSHMHPPLHMVLAFTLVHLKTFRCRLLCSKTRVAPLKHILTVPRLELCGAYLLAELIDKIKQHMQLDFEEITYWCDSTIVLGWIKTSPSLLKTFVANRVSQIQTLTKSQTWRYVNTLENPADLLSRGISPTSLINSEMWFHAPSWLAKPETHWPNRTFEPSELPELRPASALIARVHIITKISSFVKLQRIIAYVLSFINNCKFSPKQRNFDNLSCDEIDNALKYIIRLVQNETFYDNLTHLKRHGNVDSKSKLLTLNPFIDKDNILRVGGRLHNSDFCYDKKHPIVLDSKHHFTTILVRNEHLTLNHCGPQLLLASIREKFWPINGRQVVRKIVRDCIIWCRVTPKLETYLMGNLPSSRLVPFRPFYNCGLDYAGPFLLKDRHTGNYKTIKGYIALFICLATKAIHLEVVSSLTTESFLSTLKRFISRRGKYASILSDNGSTFVGAKNELVKFFDTSSSTIRDNLTTEGINWQFIPPRSPHFGGVWEAGVKSVKFHLIMSLAIQFFHMKNFPLFYVKLKLV
ncbi:uncharacterized protein [Diabrotica undecimpunctata]|uniref:uncharacterized protein n=1 Tax=Diabrotica undecimpunctata TaxID=50387 RepID=UPI003B634FE9